MCRQCEINLEWFIFSPRLCGFLWRTGGKFQVKDWTGDFWSIKDCVCAIEMGVMYLFLVGQLHRWSAGGSASSLGKPERPFQMRLFLPAGPIAIIIKIILGYCPFQSSSQFFLFFWTGMETCSSHLVRKGSKKEGEKYGILPYPRKSGLKAKA